MPEDFLHREQVAGEGGEVTGEGVPDVGVAEERDEVMEPRLVGAMDLVVHGADRPEIVEHKTASKRYAQWQLDLDTQPTIYLHAAREMGLGEADVRYQLLVKTKVPSLQQCPIIRTDSQIREALETVCQVLRAIEAGVFYRNRSWACEDCPFLYRCDKGL